MDIYCWKTCLFCRLVQWQRPAWSLYSCDGPVVDGHHSHASLIAVDYQISWNAVLRRRRRYCNFPLAPPNVGQLLSRLRSISHHEAHALHKRCPTSSEHVYPPVAFWMPPEQWHCWQHPSNFVKYVCTCWSTTAPRRTYIIVCRTRRWCSNRVACPPVRCAEAKYCFEGIEQ